MRKTLYSVFLYLLYSGSTCQCGFDEFADVSMTFFYREVMSVGRNFLPTPVPADTDSRSYTWPPGPVPADTWIFSARCHLYSTLMSCCCCCLSLSSQLPPSLSTRQLSAAIVPLHAAGLGPAAPRPPLRAVKRPARARQLLQRKPRRHGPGAHHRSPPPLFTRGLGARAAVASRHAFKASLQ